MSQSWMDSDTPEYEQLEAKLRRLKPSAAQRWTERGIWLAVLLGLAVGLGGFWYGCWWVYRQVVHP